MIDRTAAYDIVVASLQETLAQSGMPPLANVNDTPCSSARTPFSTRSGSFL